MRIYEKRVIFESSNPRFGPILTIARENKHL